jgi:hypothetical protein
MWISTAYVAEHLRRIHERLSEMEMTLMSAIDDLKADVAANRTVVDSAITLLNGLHQQLMDAIASGDPAALTGLADDLKSQTDALASAVAANTSAPPQP